MTRLYRLFRLPLALMNGAAALGGYLLFPAPPEAAHAASVFAGVSLLAAAASALNQVLERDLDALMRRTSKRPLPAGELHPASAVLLGLAALLAGAYLLSGAGGLAPVVLGVLTLLWYLMVYTPLKRRSSLALLLGSLCGCAAPMIGWSVAGGGGTDFRIVLLAGTLYLWQVPHFWLLQRRHADDYRRAGVLLFAPGDEGSRSERLLRLWMAAMIAGALMLPAFGLIDKNVPLWCLAFSVPLFLAPFPRLRPAVFAGVNLFPALITLALYLGR